MYQARSSIDVRYVIETALDEGITTDRCLTGSSLAPYDLQKKGLVISPHQEATIIRNLLKHAGRPGLGFSTGKRYHLTSLGILGFTMLACETLQDAFKTCNKYHRLIPRACSAKFLQDPRGLWLIFDDSEIPPDIRAFFVERVIAAYLQVTSELLSRQIKPSIIEIKTKKPKPPTDHYNHFPHLIKYAANQNAILIAECDLIEKLPQANHDVKIYGEQLCEKAYIEPGLSLANTPISRQVQELLLRHPSTKLNSQAIAHHIGLSDRTLHRRLNEEGYSIQSLIDQTKKTLSERLLIESRMGLEQIAHSLGYTNATSFSHAFKRWTGHTPGRWRKKSKDTTNNSIPHAISLLPENFERNTTQLRLADISRYRQRPKTSKTEHQNQES